MIGSFLNGVARMFFVEFFRSLFGKKEPLPPEHPNDMMNRWRETAEVIMDSNHPSVFIPPSPAYSLMDDRDSPFRSKGQRLGKNPRPRPRPAPESFESSLVDPSEILERRNRYHLTQSQLANLVGVSKTTIHLWEKGKVHPTKHHVERLNEVFGRLKVDDDAAASSVGGRIPETAVVSVGPISFRAGGNGGSKGENS